MQIRVGDFVLELEPGDFPSTHDKLKQELRDLARVCGVNRVRFVEDGPRKYYGGYYNPITSTIVIVASKGKRKISRTKLAYRFFHELGHHIQLYSGLFLANYARKVTEPDGTERKFSQADHKRVALRAERHADWVACKLAREIYGIIYELDEPYSKDFLRKHHHAFAS